jgi:hypothetical protein
VIGRVEVPPAAGSAVIADLAGSLVVRLASAAMLLSDADGSALVRGANLALVGDELIQFGVAEPLGGAMWRVSRLLRGRRGTEWAMGAQGAGDRFVLLEDGAVRTVGLPAGTRTARVIASGVGDDEPVAVDVAIDGSSLLPPSVARLRWEPGAGGVATVRWMRRSRLGWRWVDGAEVPLGEEAERYLVTIVDASGERTELRDSASVDVARPATVTVRQRGTHGDSRGATLFVPV